MAALFKVVCLVALLAAAAEGAGGSACGKLSPDKVAVQLAPCAAAGRDPKAAVSSSCCLQVKRIGRNPKCLCAVLLSATAKASGVKPAVAITIPKRCRLANRPVGFKCGPYTLP
ncbi:non-specific lipid-transfer protein-like [Salvia miltiorrhiza]|uniref:non-specific lipid-transfer protein-like n=1 Tax=Salvia miltiorrhiza TaxID=226208 RepID=UPI0025AC341E|nr:non-specific lipid-transfer protein-like [Salvia miltiorrhiza]